MTLHSIPIFVRLAGRPVMLLGEGEAADAKRRILERGGAVIVGEDATAALAIIAIEEEDAAVAAVGRLRARGLLVNAVDRPALCDFTLPAIVDRAPLLLAIGTGGASAGMAAAVRQRLEALLPADLGARADALFAARGALKARFPDGGERRRALAAAMAAGGALDPLADAVDVAGWIAGTGAATGLGMHIVLRSGDPDDLTIRETRALASADCVWHRADVPLAILTRARADAARMPCDAAPPIEPGTVFLEMGV
ncbi:siroheme synthase [Sphingomonas sp. Leaf17]|uniref:precorrin-2 dehydrogenase/sirohydrochlorin ferrochelatase family protein n=1 Tax=Sphingomonas sp. Leaf17 TaxID=1735683 RepID=UPI0006FCF1CD|nr:NAD(P)-dependent oxidoreductase [Sphingomonas sp. Leaf17]KQM64208.1 siroheme synthase [Sphingomonas sp. Leaf17]